MHSMTQPGKTDTSDQGLLARAMQGDTEAFGDLYARYLDEILRYVFYRVANRFEAEDLTETVFLKAWDALSRFESSEVNFRAWLYRIAHNVTVDYYRTRQPSFEMPDAQLHDLQPSPEHQLQIRDQHKGLALAIQSLEDSLQQVITCRFINGLSHAETAQIMGLKEGHVRVLQLRALQKLRLILEKQE
jgi:RNA polymerase sigma-70 factor, ECF subfamily